jgi:type I restriction enzyme S subunit
MSNKGKTLLMPKLRFPEFCGALDWKETRLGQLGELVSGLTYSPDDVRETGLLVLRSSNVQNGKIALDDCVYVDPATKGANLSQANDILICVRNGSVSLIGKNALISEGMPLCTHGAFMTVFRSKSAKFVFQLFQSDRYQKQVAGDLGATINSINGGQLVKYTFAVPQPPEQQKIADCLSSLDELITAQARKVDALKTHKKGLMQQLFPREGETQPRLRFPEFRDAGDWVEKNLEAICTIQRGKFSHRPRNDPRFFGGKYPFIQTGDVVKSNGGAVQASQTLNEQGLSVSKLFKPPIVLITIAANIGDTGLLDREACFTDSVVGLIPKSGVSAVFLELAVRGKKEYLNKIAPAAAQKNINNEILSVLLILIPDFEEQQRIANCLTSLDTLITAATQELETLKTQKKGLMQQLFPSAEAAEA